MASENVTLSKFNQLLTRTSQPVTFTKALKIIEMLLVSKTRENFDGQHDPEGIPWKPLKRPRKARKWTKKKRIKVVDRILQDTHLLMASVTAKGSAGNVHEVTPFSLTWGTEVEYAGVHQFGFPGPDKLGRMLNIPQRSFLGITDQMEEELEDIVTNEVMNQIIKGIRP